MQVVQTDHLVDLREVLASLDSERHMRSEDKMRAFLEKIKNPYEFKVGPVVVHSSFAGEMSMDDCFARYLSAI